VDSDKPKKPQIDKFREAARELETDDSEERFDRVVKSLVKPKPPKNDNNTDSKN
jgi:hypothetical protein